MIVNLPITVSAFTASISFCFLTTVNLPICDFVASVLGSLVDSLATFSDDLCTLCSHCIPKAFMLVFLMLVLSQMIYLILNSLLGP